MKRLLSLALALMGTLVILAGCTVYAEKQERNSREWIEGKLSALDKVYPTENLYDLFAIHEGLNFWGIQKIRLSQEMCLLSSWRKKSWNLW